MRSLLLVLAFTTQVASQSIKSCGGPNDHLKNPVIKLTPDPPVKGGTLTIEASGTLDEVEGDFNANVDLSIQALRIVHASVSGDVPVSISPGAVKGPFSLTVGPFSLPSVPGNVVVKGQVHVNNAKKEQILCIDLDLNVPGMGIEETQVALPQNKPSVTTLSSCGKATDHAPDFKIESSAGTVTMTGTLDESVNKASIDLDVSLKVLFISVPLKMSIPVTVSDGLIDKGAFKATIGPSTLTVTPDVKAAVKGTMKISDGSNEEITCINVDTVVANQPSQVAKQCTSASYAFCCEVGTPCDCRKGTVAPGQCKPESYAFCCSVGTPCDCTQPPSGNVTQNVMV